MDLTALRTEIDAIDRELVALFDRRMAIAHEVAAYKKEHNLPILDASREVALLERVAALSAYPQETEALYRCILSLSRNQQERWLEEH